MKIKILVAHHKKSILINDDVYFPIHVGKANSNIDLGIAGDNTGDNISYKNSIYCEMSAVYWGWKNLSADYIGLCHYRRYFTFKQKPLYKRIFSLLKYYGIKLLGNILKPGADYTYCGQIRVEDESIFRANATIFSTQIKELINKNQYDLIAPTPYRFACRNIKQFFEVLGREHISLICEIASEISPDFYYYINKTLASNELYAANMFIMANEIYNDYCQTIFPILLEHEKRTLERGWCNDLLNEKAYSRLSGYFAEFLTSAYILKLKLNRKNILFVNTVFYNE